MRKLDEQRRALLGSAKQIIQTGNIAEELNRNIERLSSLVDGLTVCQIVIVVNNSKHVVIHVVLARPKRYSPPILPSKLVPLVIFP